MRRGPVAGRAAGASAVALALLVGGCGHVPAMHWPKHWPWQRQPPPAATPVHELDISTGAQAPGASSGAAGAFAQYWKRNTLVVDLSAASGTGAITLTPAAGTAWPVRLALRVTPGSVGVLSVVGDERFVIPITPVGQPIDLELAPGIYTSKTRQIAVSWGPQSAPID